MVFYVFTAETLGRRVILQKHFSDQMKGLSPSRGVGRRIK
jgi:hypothetical protein